MCCFKEDTTTSVCVAMEKKICVWCMAVLIRLQGEQRNGKRMDVFR